VTETKKIFGDYETLTSIFLFAGSVVVFFVVSAFPDASSIFPRMVTGLAIFLTAIMVLKSAKRVEEIEVPPPFFINSSKFVIGSGMMFLYLLSINYFGYFTSTLIFIPTLARLLSYNKLAASVFLTIIYVLVIYLIFVVIFKTTLPPEIFSTS